MGSLLEVMKTPDELHEEFEIRGFLGKGIASGIPDLRAENEGWFTLIEDVNELLVRTAAAATNTVKTNSLAPEAVAVRIVLRSCGTLQGVILMTERGMVAEGRILTRSLVEDAFCIAALHDNPVSFLEILKEDSEGSRRLQGKFILAQDMIDKGASRDKLQAAIDALGKPDTMSPKAIAAMGPLLKQYLAYQRLSDDAAHTSARSLDRHVKSDAARSGWCYKWGAGSREENAVTLHHAVLASLPIGVAITQMLKDTDNNSRFGDLADRFQAMPPVGVI
jgi:hypothetical protein